jgi:hypothetical protein
MKHNPGHLGGYLHPRSAATRTLVNCAFCFCWDAWFHDHPALHQTAAPRPEPGRGERGGPPAAPLLSVPSWPRAIRAVRAWLIPWVTLQRWWPAAACTSTSVTNKLPLAGGRRLEPVHEIPLLCIRNDTDKQ